MSAKIIAIQSEKERRELERRRRVKPDVLTLLGRIQTQAEEAQRVMRVDLPGVASVERILELCSQLERALTVEMFRRSVDQRNLRFWTNQLLEEEARLLDESRIEES